MAILRRIARRFMNLNPPKNERMYLGTGSGFLTSRNHKTERRRENGEGLTTQPSSEIQNDANPSDSRFVCHQSMNLSVLHPVVSCPYVYYIVESTIVLTFFDRFS
jgi:hypothetical protein